MKVQSRLSHFALASSHRLATYIIPRPDGPLGVKFGVAGLTDTSRLDPFAPHPENRSIMISVFYPAAPVNACGWELVPAYPERTAAYFDAETAFAGIKTGSFEKVRMEVCEPQGQHSWEDIRAPVVMFSGGLGLSRLWYSAIAQSVASSGFTVVTVDHPYDADIVEFPDGRFVTAINSSWDEAQSELDVRARVADLSFALDELSKPEVLHLIFPGDHACKQGLNTSHAGVFGHSIGGATAAMAQCEDPRIVGGINLDGGFYGPVIKQGLKNPFMLFGHKDNSTSETWIEIWPHLNWKLDIEILNSTHTTFTDMPLLANLVLGRPLPPSVQDIVGEIPGRRARDVITRYVAAFMGMVLKGESDQMLEGPSTSYPEIVFETSPSV